MNNYELSELGSHRRLAQKTLQKELRFMKAIRLIYDRASVKYGKALKAYQKLDLLYAEQYKLTICKKKKCSKSRTKKESYNPIPAKLRKILKSLPPEAVERIIKEYEKQ